MPLKIEVVNQDTGEARQLTTLNPGDLPGSMSHNTDDGKRELYVFGCHRDGSHSVIWRSPMGFDVAEGGMRTIANFGEADLEAWPVVKQLGDGESHDLRIKTDRLPVPLGIRFTHVRAGAP